MSEYEPIIHPDIGRLLTKRELAKLLKVSLKTITNHVKSGQIPSPVLVGHSKRWRSSDIVRYLMRDRINELNKYLTK